MYLIYNEIFVAWIRLLLYMYYVYLLKQIYSIFLFNLSFEQNKILYGFYTLTQRVNGIMDSPYPFAVLSVLSNFVAIFSAHTM